MVETNETYSFICIICQELQHTILFSISEKNNEYNVIYAI